MTRTEMLARTRTLLDEASASFWTDTEIYAALADGQQECANYFLNIYKIKSKDDLSVPIPQPLEVLYKVATATTTTGIVDKPSDYWHLLSASFAVTGGLAGTFYNCRIERFSASMFFNINNTYLVASTTSPIVYDVYSTSHKFYFRPDVSGTGAYGLNYLKTPTAITASVNPELDVQTHSAIVHWATAQMLFKDQRPQEAQLHLQNFINELQIVG